jgi:phosphoglycolate phosphatase-like HAD superfamily hydrolase
MRSIVFDFDGVLADTFEVYAQFLSKVLRKDMDSARKFLHGRSLLNRSPNFFEKLLKALFLPSFRRHIRSRKDLLFTYRFTEILELPCPKAILSRSDSRVVHDLLSDLKQKFEIILGHNDVSTKILGLQYILLNPNFKLEEIIFITDTVGDILEVSQLLDMSQIFAVDWGYDSREELLKHLPADRVISDFAKIIQLAKGETKS